MTELQSPVSASLQDTTIKSNSSCQSSSSSNKIFNQCNNLIKEAKNFNLHANVLKQLLNLKDRSSGYEIYARRPSVETINTINSTSSSTHVDVETISINCGNESSESLKLSQASKSVEQPIDLEGLIETIKKLSEEVIESHRLGFCLAYNIQCLHKRLTGSPIDLHSSANMIRKLQEKYDSFKTREAILKYEFQEKRKLLRRLRYQLEETREDWRALRVTKRKPEKRIETNEDDGENNNQDDDVLWSETLRRQFASKRKQPSEESGFIESNNRSEGVEVSSSLSSTSSSPSDGQHNQGSSTSTGTKTGQPTTTRTTGYEDLAIALDNRRAKLDHLEDECYNLFASLSARSSVPVPTDSIYTNNSANQLNVSTELPIVSPLLFADDLTDDQLLDDDDDDDDDDEEEEEEEEEEVDENELSDPLSDEFDELNLPVDTLDPLDPIDATEEIDTSELPWDSNNLYESRATSLVTSESHQQMSPNNLQNNQSTSEDDSVPAINLPSSSTLSQSNMVHIGVGMDDDDDEDDEYTRQEMESLAETGEPLVLCRLRRRAVEILISRLRDEKQLHESRESELKEQLDELRRLNENLTSQLNNVKFSDWSLRSAGRLNSILITSMITLLTASVFAYFSK